MTVSVPSHRQSVCRAQLFVTCLFLLPVGVILSSVTVPETAVEAGFVRVPLSSIGGFRVSVTASVSPNSAGDYTPVPRLLLTTTSTSIVVLPASGYDVAASNTSVQLSGLSPDVVVTLDGGELLFVESVTLWTDSLSLPPVQWAGASVNPPGLAFYSSTTARMLRAPLERELLPGPASQAFVQGLESEIGGTFGVGLGPGTPAFFSLLNLTATAVRAGAPSGAATGVAATTPLVFGVDIQPPGPPSGADNVSASGELHIGGLDPLYAPNLVWSETMLSRSLPSTADQFTMYHLSVCGADLFANYTTHWRAEVDTSSACLALPAEFYRHLVAWLPVTCTDLHDLNASPADTAACVLDDPAGGLPWLSFQLSESGPPVYVSLNDLVFQDGDHSFLCLLEGSSVGHAMSVLAPELAPVVLGTLAMRALYYAVDVSAQRIGLTNKDAAWSSDAGPPFQHAACQPVPQCVGAQVLFTPARVCLSPHCSSYYFQRLDDASQTCAFRTSFKLFFVVLVVCLGIAELVMLRWRSRLEAEAVRQTTSSAGAAEGEERRRAAHTPLVRRRANRRRGR